MPIQKRLAAIEKNIAEINPKTDVRIRLMGIVIGKSDNTVVLDDGSDKVDISFNESIDYLKIGQKIRVITRVMPSINGFECIGECIQNLDDFDISLYRKVKNLRL